MEAKVMKVNRLNKLLLSLALMMVAANLLAAPQLLAALSDPAGDDSGDGSLVYPQRNDFQQGDLDLLKLNISRDAEGFWFEAKFRNPVRDPDQILDTMTSQSLSDFARKGFYQFNLDVYVDTDRIAGSGNTFTLPGRQVRIAPDYAWERAVILTPRPELMRQQLLDTLAEQYPERKPAALEASVDQAIFFPTRIRVKGKTVALFVPASFFAGSDGTDWAVTALVTGALTSIPADLTLLPQTKKPLERLQLGVMQPTVGHPVDTFGYAGGVPPSPVVDLLSATLEEQQKALVAKNEVVGMAWGAHAGGAATSPIAAVPADTAIEPVGRLFQPDSAQAPVTVPVPAEAGPAQTAPAPESTIVKRLQTLQQLYDQKLIDENEYKEQKQRILNQL